MKIKTKEQKLLSIQYQDLNDNNMLINQCHSAEYSHFNQKKEKKKNL